MAVDARPVARSAPFLRGRRRSTATTAGLIGTPIVWLVVFFLVPVGIAALYSVGVFSFFPGEQRFTLTYWKDFVDGSVYLDVFWRSVKISLLTSVIAVLLAYPLAYYLALVAGSRKYVLLLILISPFFVSYFLRLFAMKVLLGDQGVVNSFAYWTGIRDPEHPIPQLIYSQFAVVTTLIVIYVPFVALPIFAALENLDRRLLEAASDLGASRWQAFRKVTLPLSLPGVLAAFVFVFIPTLGEYFTPLLVGGTSGHMFGNSIADAFLSSQDWQTGSMLSVFLLATVAILMAVFARFLSMQRLETE